MPGYGRFRMHGIAWQRAREPVSDQAPSTKQEILAATGTRDIHGKGTDIPGHSGWKPHRRRQHARCEWINPRPGEQLHTQLAQRPGSRCGRAVDVAVEDVEEFPAAFDSRRAASSVPRSFTAVFIFFHLRFGPEGSEARLAASAICCCIDMPATYTRC